MSLSHKSLHCLLLLSALVDGRIKVNISRWQDKGKDGFDPSFSLREEEKITCD